VEIVRAGGPGASSRRTADAVLADAVAAGAERAIEACAGRRVLVLVPDGTRDQPHATQFRAVVPILRHADEIVVLLATGTHRPDTVDNRRIVDAVARMAANHDVPMTLEAHDCRRSRLFDAGRTSRGNPTWLNRRVAEADSIVILSDMKPHYFAGYSNATKFLLPATAAFGSIERNHALALDERSTACRHPLHDDPARQLNPVAEDQLEAARLVTERTRVFALATIAEGDHVDWATFAPLERAVRLGIREVDTRLVRPVCRRYRRAVIGCGGYPNDETLYIAQRSLELTQEALADGAEVLWLAQCANGIASSAATADHFFSPLKTGAESYVAEVSRRYVMFSHKTVRFVRLMERLAGIAMVSSLPPGTLPAGGLAACEAPQAMVDRWVREAEPILIVDGANRLALTAPLEGT
jgi:nickel-dependent lactate racemase